MKGPTNKENGSILAKVQPVYPDFHRPPKMLGEQSATDQVRKRLKYWGLCDRLPAGIVFAPDAIKRQYLQESIRWEKLRWRTS